MSFINDREVYEALLAGETLGRNDEFSYIRFKLIDNNLCRSLDSGKTWFPSEMNTNCRFLSVLSA
jgi:hypothetical protein